MISETTVESGLQVITRLTDRPPVQNLDNDLFFKNVQNTDIIEIRGTISSGVTALLTKLIAKCILPSKYNGLQADVLFINTDNQFQISYLFNTLKSEICDIEGPINVDNLVKKLLNSLKIINCYNYHQFFLTISSLDDILLKNKKVSLIVIDSISAYYWQQKEELSYNSFLIKLLNIIKKVTIEFKVMTLYTKQFNFESKKETMEWHEGKKILRYEICLTRNKDSDKLICNIKSGKDKKQLFYTFDDNGIAWENHENKKS